MFDVEKFTIRENHNHYLIFVRGCFFCGSIDYRIFLALLRLPGMKIKSDKAKKTFLLIFCPAKI
jgi:hypothetical protein